MRQCDERRDIEIDDLELAFEIETREISRRSKPGVVDQPVDLEPLFLRFIEELDIGLELEEIDGEETTVDLMLRGQLIAKRLELFARASYENEVMLLLQRAVSRNLRRYRSTRR
jgi:hypothetical protein